MRLRGGAAAAILAAAILAGAISVTGTLQAQAPAVFIDYELTQNVTNGGGAYEGWSDRLTASGHYEVQEGSVWARYPWHYHSPDEDRSGSVERHVRFDPETRFYAGGNIDLDDYDERPIPTEGRSIWWHVPPDLEAGASIRILDEMFVVVGHVPASSATHGRESILVEQAHGVGTRDDAYGHYTTTFRDQYWFDAETGYFLREVYEEHDVGTLEGARAVFDVLETVEAVAASYLPGTTSHWSAAAPDVVRFPTSAASPARRYVESAPPFNFRRLRPLIVWAAIALLVVYAGWRWMKRRRATHDYGGSIGVVASGTALPSELKGASELFAPLLPHLVRQTLQAGLPVAIAKNGEQIDGIALGAPSGEAATIFARDTAACEALRRRIDAQHFFSEVRHGHAFAVRAAATQHKTTLEGEFAYNVLETHEVLVLEPLPADVSYDRKVVRRAKEADLPKLIAMADQVYKISCKRWIEAVHATGDVILMASDGEAVVGMAIVSVSGPVARFHGLTVAETHRRKGIGKELNRARLRVASDLSAERAVVEIAAWNVASLEIARAAGFNKAGQMFVQTTSPTKVDQKFRRP